MELWYDFNLAIVLIMLSIGLIIYVYIALTSLDEPIKSDNIESIRESLFLKNSEPVIHNEDWEFIGTVDTINSIFKYSFDLGSTIPIEGDYYKNRSNFIWIVTDVDVLYIRYLGGVELKTIKMNCIYCGHSDNTDMNLNKYRGKIEQ